MKMKHKIILTVFLWSMLVSLCMLPLDHIDFNFVNKNVVTLMICIYVCISLIAFLTAWLIGGCIDHLLKNISENKKQNNHIRSVTVIFGEGHQYAEIKSEVCNENHSKWKCLYCNMLNNFADTACSSCGAPKGRNPKDFFYVDSTWNAANVHENL